MKFIFIIIIGFIIRSFIFRKDRENKNYLYNRFKFDHFVKKYFKETDSLKKQKLLDSFPLGKKYSKNKILPVLREKVEKRKKHRLFDWVVFAYLDGLDQDYYKTFVTLLNSDFHKLHPSLIRYLNSFENPELFIEQVYNLALKDFDYIKPEHDKWSFKYSCFRFLRDLNSTESIEKSKLLDVENGFEKWEKHIDENVQY